MKDMHAVRTPSTHWIECALRHALTKVAGQQEREADAQRAVHGAVDVAQVQCVRIKSLPRRRVEGDRRYGKNWHTITDVGRLGERDSAASFGPGTSCIQTATIINIIQLRPKPVVYATRTPSSCTHEVEYQHHADSASRWLSGPRRHLHIPRCSASRSLEGPIVPGPLPSRVR